MAGSGVALRLHEFRESRDPDAPTTLTPKTSRLGRDVHGLYPGQLGRVHTVHSKDCGYNLHSGRSRSLHESPNPQHENYLQSFDIQTLRALTVLRHSPAVPRQCPPQTAYQQEFGLQSPLFPQ
ncbi:protein SPMIP3-like [Trachinotus anak]|uniref:protein SPMIP3-like n=1 Tax=Trachinotus anak TaxID=443729 RepID=UPI0039F1A26E